VGAFYEDALKAEMGSSDAVVESVIIPTLGCFGGKPNQVAYHWEKCPPINLPHCLPEGIK
jgi:hypothetical protein